MNKSAIIQKVLSEFYQRNLDNELKVENNIQLARQKSPEFFKLEKQLRLLNFELAKCDKKTKHKQIEKQIDDIKKQIKIELEKINLTENDIVVKPHCPLCNDLGFKDNVMCNCLRKAINKKLLEISGIKKFEGHTFKDSDENVLNKSKNLKKAYEKSWEFINKFPNSKVKNLVFLGDVGVGKTFLLECIANEFINKDYFVIYTTAFNFSNAVINALTKSDYERETLLSPFIDCDILIIDDLGSEPLMKNLTVNCLFNILNERERKNKTYIISTNLDLEQLNERYGNRVFSRLSNQRTNACFKLNGSDLRINATKNKK